MTPPHRYCDHLHRAKRVHLLRSELVLQVAGVDHSPMAHIQAGDRVLVDDASMLDYQPVLDLLHVGDSGQSAMEISTVFVSPS